MKLQLNFNKPNNYAFFCPVSRLHLTRTNPIGYANEVTPSIKRALKVGNILDITEDKAESKTEASSNDQTLKEEKVVQEVEVKEPIEEAKVEQQATSTEESTEQLQAQVESEPVVNEEPSKVSKEEKRNNRGRKRSSNN
jgi:hypothetical protein